MIGDLGILQPDVLQLTSEYSGSLGLEKEPRCLLISAIKSYSMIGRMAERMYYPGKDFCRSCLDEKESVQYLVYDCFAIQRRELQCLGRRNFNNLDSLNHVLLMSLL